MTTATDDAPRMRPARFAPKISAPPEAVVGRGGLRKCMFRLPADDARYFRDHSAESMRKQLIEWVACHGPYVPPVADRFNEHRAVLGLPPVAPPARRDQGPLEPIQLSLQLGEIEVIDRLAEERHLSRSAFLTEVVRLARA
jgi:hypothetical protein